ncbi:hypothetical protein [Wolbachia endosymbiont of Mansonella perstans]|uniref:hypothetical protein n=1 Tax=Wolbachia endosymbiont of Mansonella perstans TaxID=229526 RepID=UPI001CE204EE|nr:hypothetical protein [Wolbachia endosymbiont of Mansonella perstans]MCA4774141.1 hypothetical protein [Wolbachia endosymbiont of Mansonella perstans]
MATRSTLCRDFSGSSAGVRLRSDDSVLTLVGFNGSISFSGLSSGMEHANP